MEILSKSKSFDGKTYHWCINHASWTVHTLAECNVTDGACASSKDLNKRRNKAKEALALSVAYSTIMDGDDEGSNEALDEYAGDAME
jgi:hypothetical protein